MSKPKVVKLVATIRYEVVGNEFQGIAEERTYVQLHGGVSPWRIRGRVTVRRQPAMRAKR